MRLLPCLLLSSLLAACGGYEVRNFAKTNIDLVADEFIAENRALVLELMEKLYRRNPDQLRKRAGMTIEDRLAQLRSRDHELVFEELGGLQGIEAMNLAFDLDFAGDRVFALTVGLGSMLRQAYDYKPEMFIFDHLNGPALRASAHNVEVLDWKLRNSRRRDGRHLLITYESRGVVDNLSFERLFGRLIALQEMMARIAGDRGDRAVNTAVYTVSRVFVPLPI